MSCKNMENKMYWEKEQLEKILGKESSIDEQVNYIKEYGDDLSREYCREVCPYRIDCEDNTERGKNGFKRISKHKFN